MAVKPVPEASSNTRQFLNEVFFMNVTKKSSCHCESATLPSGNCIQKIFAFILFVFLSSKIQTLFVSFYHCW